MGEEYPNYHLVFAVCVVGAILWAVTNTDANEIIIQAAPYFFAVLELGSISLYTVLSGIYILRSEHVPRGEQETPLGIIFSRGLGPIGNLLGEGIQVYSTLVAGRWLISGVGLGTWGVEISTPQRWVLLAVGCGLVVTSVLSGKQRLEELLYEI